jgi:carboxylesterase
MSTVESFASHPPLVLLHGLHSSAREFGLISLPLRNRGVELIMPMVPGYSDGARVGARASWQEWVDAAATAIAQLVPAQRPVVVGGLCVGGLIAATLALQARLAVAGLVLMSPTFEFDGWAQSRWRHLRGLGYALGLDRWIRLREREPYGVKDERIRAWVRREMHERRSSAAGPSTLPLWAIREVDRLKNHVRAGLGRLRARTLVLHARDDEVCTLSSVQRWMRDMQACDSELVVLNDSYHMITIDRERQFVGAQLQAFTRACVRATQPSEGSCRTR